MKKQPVIPDPLRLRTLPSRTEYGGLCVSPLVANWSNLTALGGKEDLQENVVAELATTPCVRVYATKNCSEGTRVAPRNRFFIEEAILSSGVGVMSNTCDPADMVWLGRKEGFIDTTNGRLLFLASTRKIYLAGRYTRHAADCIVECFKRALVDSKEIEVVVFFSPPTMGSFESFKEECAAAGIKKEIRSEVPLPPDGNFSYKSHPETHPLHKELAKKNNLGIIYRR
ncbi:MAG: hypothetical protein JWL82_417 [Parcubacteria group bacterium]|nr:hypothetical protein [Parcubacteria group bacterium]